MHVQIFISVGLIGSPNCYFLTRKRWISISAVGSAQLTWSEKYRDLLRIIRTQFHFIRFFFCVCFSLHQRAYIRIALFSGSCTWIYSFYVVMHFWEAMLLRRYVRCHLVTHSTHAFNCRSTGEQLILSFQRLYQSVWYFRYLFQTSRDSHILFSLFFFFKFSRLFLTFFDHFWAGTGYRAAHPAASLQKSEEVS